MKIVYKGMTKTGKEIIVRYPEKGDEKEMWRYINEISRERTFVRMQGEQILLKDERDYLNFQLKNIAEKKAVTLLVFYKNKMIAITGINMRDKTEKHIGLFGITVAKDFRGDGIGKLLTELIIKEAEKNLADIRIVTLEVYSTNAVARSLYKKLGFIEYGVLPNGITRGGKLEDGIFMYRNIR